MKQPKTIRDQLSFLSNAAGLRAPLVKTVSAVQDYEPHLQLLGIAATLVCLADAIGINPHDLISRAQRAAADIDGPFANQWQAMRDYARGELLK